MLKCKYTKIDEWKDELDLRHVIYFNDDYRVSEVVYNEDFTYVQTYDELDKPELSNYRIVLEKAGNV
jgi:hypothetical protein